MGSIRNSLGDLVQFVYGEDGVDGAFNENQGLPTFYLNNASFEHKYRVDVADPQVGFVRGVLQVGLDDSSSELHAKFDEEWDELCNDRDLLRTFIFRGSDATRTIRLPVNLRRIINNAIQIFHIDRRKPSDLEPTYIVDAVKQLTQRLVVVRGDDRFSGEIQNNASLLFRMLFRATFAARCVLGVHHLPREAFEWVLGGIETKFHQSLANLDVRHSRSAIHRGTGYLDDTQYLPLCWCRK
jgi:DNA-directed RNA polymerase II subunit RPB1